MLRERRRSRRRRNQGRGQLRRRDRHQAQRRGAAFLRRRRQAHRARGQRRGRPDPRPDPGLHRHRRRAARPGLAIYDRARARAAPGRHRRRPGRRRAHRACCWPPPPVRAADPDLDRGACVLQEIRRHDRRHGRHRGGGGGLHGRARLCGLRGSAGPDRDPAWAWRRRSPASSRCWRSSSPLWPRARPGAKAARQGRRRPVRWRRPSIVRPGPARGSRPGPRPCAAAAAVVVAIKNPSHPDGHYRGPRRHYAAAAQALSSHRGNGTASRSRRWFWR